VTDNSGVRNVTSNLCFTSNCSPSNDLWFWWHCHAGRRESNHESNDDDDDEQEESPSLPSSSSSPPKNKDNLGFAEKRELQRHAAAEKRRQKQKCYLCGKNGHVRRRCPGIVDDGRGMSRYKGKSNIKTGRINNRSSSFHLKSPHVKSKAEPQPGPSTWQEEQEEQEEPPFLTAR
jgi:hypothetical protein